jgi:sodium-dependent dicarboxylate transporter 2/3/5
MRGGERVVGAVFLAAVLLWIVSGPLARALAPHVGAFKLATAHVEGGVSMAAGLSLLLLRTGGAPVLGLAQARRVPWRPLLLLGGSFAMAASIDASGLSRWLGSQLEILRAAPGLLQVVAASLATVTLSAVASNVATTAVMLTVLHDVVSPGLMPTVLFAATIAASCDFALPAGTPPNAIAFGSGYVTPLQMARTGVLLDVSAALLAAFWCALIVERVL